MEADIYNEQITQYASQLEIKKKILKNELWKSSQLLAIRNYLQAD